MRKFYIAFILSVIGTLSANAQNVQEVSAGDRIQVASNIGTGIIRGQLFTTDHQPAPYVNVSITGINRHTETDENGYFVFNNLKEGNYTLVVSMIGLNTQEKEVSVKAGDTYHLTLTLPETSKQLDEVVVNGVRNTNLRSVSLGKAGIALLDLPQAGGVVSSKVIADQQASRLGDVVKNVSGVSLTQQRQGVAETFSARGYSIGVSGAGGSIFKNGIISNTMGFPEASTLESVEVLKGSSALLYGNTSGGVIINMVTKKPKFNKGGEVSMRYGSNDLYKPMVDIYGPITKNLAYRMVGTYENAGSYRDQVNTRRTYVNPSLLYRPGKKTTILLQFDYLDASLTPDNGIGILNSNMDAVIPASRSRFINFSWAYYKLKQSSGTLNIDHTLNESWKLNLIAAAQGTSVSAFGSSVPNAIASTGDFSRILNRTKTMENDYTMQLNLLGNFSTGFLKHRFLAGTDAVRIVTGTNAFAYFSNGVSAGNAYDKINILDPNKFVERTDIPDARDTARTTSPSYRLGYYVQDLVSITDHFKILAGIRWSYLKTLQTTIYNQVVQLERKGTAAAVENKALSPKIALIYQPLQTTSLYAGYSNNFAVNSGVDVNGAQIQPSITDQYELGVKNKLFNHKLSANFSLYRIINHNLAQMARFKADGTTVNSDANVKELTGQTTSDGFEIDLNGTLSRNFYFITGYGYNHMRYTKTSGLKGSNVQGEPLINNPEHTFNATVFYTFDLPALRGLKIGASSFYTGKRYGGINNTVGQAPVYNRLVRLSGFTTYDLSAGYTYRKVSLQAKLANITNTLNYLVHDRYSFNPIPPRQLVATLSYKF